MIKLETKAWSHKHQSSFLVTTLQSELLRLFLFTADDLVKLFIRIRTLKVNEVLQDLPNMYLDGADSPYTSTVMFCKMLMVLLLSVSFITAILKHDFVDFKLLFSHTGLHLMAKSFKKTFNGSGVKPTVIMLASKENN